MTISSEVRKAGPYDGNDVTTSFPFSFKVFSADDVVVVLTDPAGIETTLTGSGTDYSVTLNADQDTAPGGTVEKVSALATDYLLTIASSVPNLQPLDLTNQGGFYPKVINAALDRLTILAQQNAEQIGRAVKTKISSRSTPDELLDDIDASVTIAAGYAAAAAGSATNSANSATASADSATASAGSATAAANSATQAANSAASLGFTLTDLRTQGKTAATSAGAAPAFTVATDPAYGALAAGQRMRVKFHAAGTTGSNTLNRDGLGAKNLMQYDATGTKVAAVVASGQLADVEYDGTDMVVLDPLPPTAASGVPVRQTVLSGPVDSSGFAAFGGLTGSTTVTASGTLKATAAAGGDANNTGSIVNPSWTGLSTNGAMYLYLDIAANGTCTPGSTTLAPTYQWGGTYSIANGQNTYNIQEATMKVGNGAAASQVNRVFVGEVTVAGGVVTAITWYALMGRYDSGFFAVAAATAYAKNHNIGVSPLSVQGFVQTAGGVVSAFYYLYSAGYFGATIDNLTRTSMSAYTGTNLNTPDTVGGLSGAVFNSVRLVAQRGW